MRIAYVFSCLLAIVALFLSFHHTPEISQVNLPSRDSLPFCSCPYHNFEPPLTWKENVTLTPSYPEEFVTETDAQDAYKIVSSSYCGVWYGEDVLSLYDYTATPVSVADNIFAFYPASEYSCGACDLVSS